MKAISYNDLRNLLIEYDAGAITLSFLQEQLNKIAHQYYDKAILTGLEARQPLQDMKQGAWSDDIESATNLLNKQERSSTI